MADTEVNPPFKGTGQADDGEKPKSQSAIDAAIDAAMGGIIGARRRPG